MSLFDPTVVPEFSLRPGGNDASVVREVWVENVYHLHPLHFQGGTGVCVDLGANIGAFTLFALANGARRVVACEPEPENLACLRTNLSRLLPPGAEVRVVEEAVHGTEGVIRLVGSHSRVFEAEAAGDGGRPTRTISLATLFRTHAPAGCDFLKLDIEGSEYPAFEAAAPAIVGMARRISMEFHRTEQGRLGLLVEKLSETHHVEVFGKASVGGGYVHALRYGA